VPIRSCRVSARSAALARLLRGLLREDGQTILEWTVVLPLFMAISAGIIFYAWLWWNQVTAATAIHDAVYLAARHGGDIAEARERIEELLNAALGGYAEGFSYEITPDPATRSVSGTIRREKVVDLPFLGEFLFSVKASSFQRLERFWAGPPSGWW